MKIKDIIISAIDLLTLFLTVTIIAIFAINYDSDKGIGNQDFISIVPLTVSMDVKGNLKSFDFYPVIIGKHKIKLSHYIQGENIPVGMFDSVESLGDSGLLDKEKIYVIYEEDKSEYFSDIVRLFSRNGIPIGVAKISK